MMVSSRRRETQSDALSALFTSCLTAAAYYEASTTNLARPQQTERRLGQVQQAGSREWRKTQSTARLTGTRHARVRVWP